MKADEEGEGDLGDVAMPGFIDILSSVITVFMFFMLITSAIMFFMSMAMKKNVVDETRKEAQAQVTQQVQDYIHKLQAGEITVKELNSKVEQMKPDQVAAATVAATVENPQQGFAIMSKSTAQTVSTEPGSRDLVILFSDKGISVSDDTAKSLAAFLDGMKSNGKSISVELDAPDNPNAPTLSISREVALGRALNVRNVLLARKLQPAKISVHDVPAEAYHDSYDWVRIRVHQ